MTLAEEIHAKGNEIMMRCRGLLYPDARGLFLTEMEEYLDNLYQRGLAVSNVTVTSSLRDHAAGKLRATVEADTPDGSFTLNFESFTPPTAVLSES